MSSLRKPSGTAKSASVNVFRLASVTSIVEGDEPLRVTVELGGVASGGGVCAEIQFAGDDCEFKASNTKLQCRE